MRTPTPTPAAAYIAARREGLPPHVALAVAAAARS